MDERTEVARLRDELAALRDEVASLRMQVAGGAAPAADGDAPTDRRGFFKLAAGAAAGAVAAAVVGAEPAAATTGQPLLIGIDPNETTSVTDVTVLQHPSSTALASEMLLIRNDTAAIPPIEATYKVAIHAATTGTPSTGTFLRVGTLSETVGDSGIGVLGKSNDPDNRPVPTVPIGVLGQAGSAGIGVQGLVTAAGATAVKGVASHVGAFGVNAQNTADGVALFVDDRLVQGFPGVAGPPAVGVSRFKGEYYRDGAGDLFLCTADGNPGTWRRVVAQHPNFASAGGSINLFAAPIRILDTRGLGAPLTNGVQKLAANTPTTFQVTGTAVGGVSVPAGARGILGNITAVFPTGGGHINIYAANAPLPTPSNLNFTAQTQAIANSVIVALSPTGAVKVNSAASACDFILDVAGFLF